MYITLFLLICKSCWSFLAYTVGSDTGRFLHRVADLIVHDDVIKWKHFPCYWQFVRGIHRSPGNYPHKGQWRGALMFSLICTGINGWINNGEAGDLRRYRGHYDVNVMRNEHTCVTARIQWLICSPKFNRHPVVRRRASKLTWQRHRRVIKTCWHHMASCILVSISSGNGLFLFVAKSIVPLATNVIGVWLKTHEEAHFRPWLITSNTCSIRIQRDIQRIPLFHDLTINNG